MGVALYYPVPSAIEEHSSRNIEIAAMPTLSSAVIVFVSGFAYGCTSVIVGQPFDTVKTKIQTSTTTQTMSSVASKLFREEGIRGLYRGSLPLVIGGAVIRSSQFGVNDIALTALRHRLSSGKPIPKAERILGVFDYQVIVAGYIAGIARGLVEGPFEFFKVRRQVNEGWKLREVFSGLEVTILRNSFLFSSFMIYIDLSKLVIEGGLSPFWTGAICANMAWLTIWPLDVAKTMVQSGKYSDKSTSILIADIFRTGALYRGLLPGLIRSTLSNGCSMVVYKKCEAYLESM